MKLIQNDLRLGAALEANDDAHAVTVALVAEFVAGNVADDALVDEFSDSLDELGLVDLIGNLGDDDGFSSAGDLFDGALGAHHEAAAAGGVGVADGALAEDKAAGWEVRSFDVLEDEVEIAPSLRLVLRDERDTGVDDLGEVVRRDVGRHADGDTAATIDDEVGDARGQHGGLE